ncbi:hypothetical protein [Hyphomicrobium sp.]|uniref:hypothetical protein n=1 Tax=Hyphomicrobium sp. TaxID=82 RepID=UPI001D8A850B|nr:hypothetical protein [Hyphomicrobium sp.]MBY0560418.1 hypothetical protein [Hyphomicrobium sp.]
MSRKLLSLFAGGALVLATAATGAAAASINPGGLTFHSTGSLQIPVRSGGGGMHAGSGGHMMGGPHFAGPLVHRQLGRTYMAGHHHHHHNRFFFAGYPYYYYDDGYYDDYDSSCWWSRSHRRWICSD